MAAQNLATHVSNQYLISMKSRIVIDFVCCEEGGDKIVVSVEASQDVLSYQSSFFRIVFGLEEASDKIELAEDLPVVAAHFIVCLHDSNFLATIKWNPNYAKLAVKWGVDTHIEAFRCCAKELLIASCAALRINEKKKTDFYFTCALHPAQNILKSNRDICPSCAPTPLVHDFRSGSAAPNENADKFWQVAEIVLSHRPLAEGIDIVGLIAQHRFLWFFDKMKLLDTEELLRLCGLLAL